MILLIRLACADDLDAVDAIYDAILTLEEAAPYPSPTGSGASIPLWTTPAVPWRSTPSGWPGRMGSITAPLSSTASSFRSMPRSLAVSGSAGPGAVIHTLMVHPDWSGRGKGRELVAFCEEESRRQGKSVIRLDTPEGNTPANLMYARLGYRLAGLPEFFSRDLP